MSAVQFGDVRLPPRFWSKAVPNESGCWVWTAGWRGKGYAAYSPARRPKYAHRVAYETLVGNIPKGFQIDHRCRNRRCVNPAHLESVSPRTNVLRGIGHTAQNARKTACKWGHPFDAGNTYYYPDGERGCVACRKEWRARDPRRNRSALSQRREG